MQIFLEHTNPLFLQQKILKIYDLIKLSTLSVMYRAKEASLPFHVQNFFKAVTNEGIITRNKHVNNFKLNFVQIKRKQFCISFHGVKLWNALECYFKNCTNIKRFKYMYKEKCLDSYKNRN